MGPKAIGGANDILALKLLFPHLSDQSRYREMFMAEARLSLMLNHPNITHTVHAEAPPDEGPCYMVMELLEGMTLAQLERGLGKKGQKLPLEVSAYIVGELLRALEYAHSLRNDAGSTIVHRDVSPQNVMLTTSGQVKLMDFGIARFATEETTGNFVKGKLQYMPPEQFRRATRKPTVDLFAVGAILHELIDGRPFRAKLEQERLFAMVLEGGVPDLYCDPASVPYELDSLRLSLLAADENARTQSAREGLEALYTWPDYRNASATLQQLVQRFIPFGSAFTVPTGTGTPATAAYTALASHSPSESSPEHEHEPEHTYSGWSQATSPSNAEIMAGSQAAETLPDGTNPAPSTNSTLTPPAHAALTTNSETPPPSQRERSRPWVLPVAMGLSIVSLGVLGAIALTWTNAAATREPAVPTPTSAPTPAPTPAPANLPSPAAPAEVPEPIPEPIPEDPLPVVDPIPVEDPDPVVDADLTPEAEAEAAPTTKAHRVSVEFVANEFFFVYVKVKGRTLTLEPRARAKLPVGRHVVYMRSKPEDEWVRAGTISIAGQGSYRVEMTKPHGLRLVHK